MAILDIKFTKFDNRPWGFRLAGGSDFPQPLTVIRVSEESLAECMGMKVGDVILRLNDKSISDMTHGQAHEALTLAGNNFVITVQRAEDPTKLPNIPIEELVPYAIPLESLPPLEPIDEKLKEPNSVIEETSISLEENTKILTNGELGEEEPEEEKPTDENSVIVANKDMTDEEIAQLILEEEEILTEKGLLGINFKKLRPRLTALKDSKVIEALQDESLADPPVIQERKRTTTFLQKPERAPPVLKKKEEPPSEVEPYKVVIKKQPRKSVTEKLLEKGLIKPEDVKTPESRSEINTPDICNQEPPAESRPESKAEVIEVTEAPAEEEADQVAEPRIVEPAEPEIQKEDSNMAQPIPSLTTFDKERVQELVSTEISLEKQLESVQSQLMALKQLPSEIEKHLKVVSEQLHRIMELSGVQNGTPTKDKNEISDRNLQNIPPEEEEQSCPKEEPAQESCQIQSSHKTESIPEENEEELEQESQVDHHLQSESTEWDDPSFSVSFNDHAPPNTEPTQDSETETRELEISLRSEEEEGKRVKKYIVSYETKLLEKKEIRRSEESSPAPSHGSFEPDPNLAPQDQVIQELQHRAKDKKKSRELWPQAKQLELTYGRRWRCPNDFFNDDMIAEVLQSQTEVIRGKAMGVNFKKFEKTALPNYDHLMNSSVYKVIHNMEREPKKGIPARPPKVNAAEDILERVNSPMDTLDDRSSLRSVSH